MRTVSQAAGEAPLTKDLSGGNRGSRPPLNREVRHRIRRPNVLGPGAYEPIVVELLDDMRSPAGDPAQGEDGRIQVDVEAQGGVGRSRVKVDVRVELFFLVDEEFNRAGHFKPFGIA